MIFLQGKLEHSIFNLKPLIDILWNRIWTHAETVHVFFLQDRRAIVELGCDCWARLWSMTSAFFSFENSNFYLFSIKPSYLLTFQSSVSTRLSPWFCYHLLSYHYASLIVSSLRCLELHTSCQEGCEISWESCKKRGCSYFTPIQKVLQGVKWICW